MIFHVNTAVMNDSWAELEYMQQSFYKASKLIHLQQMIKEDQNEKLYIS